MLGIVTHTDAQLGSGGSVKLHDRGKANVDLPIALACVDR